MTSTSLPRSPCLPMQPCVSPRVPIHAHLDSLEPHRAPTAALRAFPASSGELPYRLRIRCDTEPSSSSRQHRHQDAYRGHRAIPCDSLCDGLGSVRECSLERFYGLGIATGCSSRDAHRPRGIGSRYIGLPGQAMDSSQVSRVLAVSLAVLIATARVSLGI